LTVGAVRAGGALVDRGEHDRGRHDGNVVDVTSPAEPCQLDAAGALVELVRRPGEEP
jgi:hypothetical protein